MNTSFFSLIEESQRLFIREVSMEEMTPVWILSLKTILEYSNKTSTSVEKNVIGMLLVMALAPAGLYLGNPAQAVVVKKMTSHP
jgi:hypothetical protein